MELVSYLFNRCSKFSIKNTVKETKVELTSNMSKKKNITTWKERKKTKFINDCSLSAIQNLSLKLPTILMPDLYLQAVHEDVLLGITLVDDDEQ